MLYNGQDLKEIELAALNRLLRKLETTGEDQTTERERDFLKRLGRIELTLANALVAGYSVRFVEGRDSIE